MPLRSMKRLIRQSTMSDEHALVNLDQRFFDNPGSAVRCQKGKRSAVAKPRDRPAQPAECPFAAAVGSFHGSQGPGNSPYAVRFLDTQLFAPRTSMLESTGRDHHRVNLCAIEAQRKQTVNHSRRQTVLHDAQQIRFRCRRVDAEPIPNLNMGSTHLLTSLHYAIK